LILGQWFTFGCRQECRCGRLAGDALMVTIGRGRVAASLAVPAFNECDLPRVCSESYCSKF